MKGPNVYAGYWGRPEATAAAFREGWFRTGDIGRIDADGYVTLEGRKSDLIIAGGFNIYPREIEEWLLEQPEVARAAVAGRPDPAKGEVPVAYLVLREGLAGMKPGCVRVVRRRWLALSCLASTCCWRSCPGMRWGRCEAPVAGLVFALALGAPFEEDFLFLAGFPHQQNPNHQEAQERRDTTADQVIERPHRAGHYLDEQEGAQRKDEKPDARESDQAGTADLHANRTSRR